MEAENEEISFRLFVEYFFILDLIILITRLGSSTAKLTRFFVAYPTRISFYMTPSFVTVFFV